MEQQQKNHISLSIDYCLIMNEMLYATELYIYLFKLIQFKLIQIPIKISKINCQRVENLTLD